MRNEALVSIGLMVYNHEAFIEDCLKSLLQQDYPNMELIILDDASTDRSREIISRYCDIFSLTGGSPKLKLSFMT